MAVIVVNSNGFACTLYSGGIASFNRSNKYFFTLATLRHLGRVKVIIVKISESTLMLKRKFTVLYKSNTAKRIARAPKMSVKLW